jgi:hypothetical protein
VAIRLWLLRRLGNGLAFVLTVGLGIVAGSLLSASEAVEEQFASKKRHSIEKQGPTAPLMRGPK